MCELSPALRDATDRYRWEIRPKGRPGRLERVAASAGKLDGKNISFLVVDELHEWNLENWAILTNGTVGRRRAQIVQITTAGHDLKTICGREYQKGQRILAGEEKNPGYLFRWFEAPAGADYRSEETWRLANPSYGELVSREQLADKVANVLRPLLVAVWSSAALGVVFKVARPEVSRWLQCRHALIPRDQRLRK